MVRYKRECIVLPGLMELVILSWKVSIEAWQNIFKICVVKIPSHMGATPGFFICSLRRQFYAADMMILGKIDSKAWQVISRQVGAEESFSISGIAPNVALLISWILSAPHMENRQCLRWLDGLIWHMDCKFHSDRRCYSLSCPVGISCYNRPSCLPVISYICN